MLRNLCVGLGNSGEALAVPILMRCLGEPSSLIREHAAWALGRLTEVRETNRPGS
jgi:epoxyqueuosine reductase